MVELPEYGINCILTEDGINQGCKKLHSVSIQQIRNITDPSGIR